MPYLPLAGYIKFDNLTLWSFEKHKETFIKDIPTKEHIEKLVKCYQYHNKKPIDNPSIVSISGIHFSNPNNQSIKKIEALKNILLVSGILENNSWSFVTSDNFEVFYQRFNIGDEGISTQAGAINNILTGGYKISEVAFAKPEHTNIPFKLRLNGFVVNALEDCLKNSSSNAIKSQIIQSLNPFFNAYRNSHEHSWASRILLLIISFELLFGETGRSRFRNNIQKYSTLDSKFNPPTYKYPIYNRSVITSYEQLTLAQIWAEEFYKLRHKIIHGDTVYSDDFIFKDLIRVVKKREPHFYIAVNFFIVCLLNKLKELGYSRVPHLIINTELKEDGFGKNISGIKDETFKIQDLDFYDLLSKNLA